MPGQDMFLAFTGVALPHPGQALMHAMQIMACFSSSAAGYTNMFGYAVHAKTIDQSQAYKENTCGARHTWRISYSDIEVTDPIVYEEMCSFLPGIAECSMTSLAFFIEDIRLDTRPHVHEFADALRPGAARLLASSHIPFDDGVQMPMASL